jgi:transposase InsO family protein
MESCLSSASISDRPAWPSTWSGDEIRRPKAGGHSSAITLMDRCDGHVRRADNLVSLLYGLLIMGHGRRQIVWLGVTAHPTAEWIANQITEAFGGEKAPRCLIRDRDRAYGNVFIRRLRSMGIRDQPTSPRSPWQNGCAERLIGSIRRECLDHVVVLGERHSVIYYCLTSNIIMRYARIYPWRRTRRSRALWNGPDAFFVAQFLEGSTTNMSGFDLRQGQAPDIVSSIPLVAAGLVNGVLFRPIEGEAPRAGPGPGSGRSFARNTPSGSASAGIATNPTSTEYSAFRWDPPANSGFAGPPARLGIVLRSMPNPARFT